MKKISALIAVFALAISVAACGKAPASTPADGQASKPTSTSTPATSPTSAAADEEQEYSLDYDTIAAWIDSGFLGQTDDGAPALLAVNKDTTMAIVIFADNDTMEAVSFVGDFIDNDDGTATIEDAANELSLTFGFALDGDTTYLMDMGEEMGSAILSPASADELKEQLKIAIDNYKHVA